MHRTDDEHVVDVDRTEELLEEFSSRDNEVESPAEFADGYYGWRPVKEGSQPDLSGENKYGYIVVSESGSLVRAIDRTNPNKKWDWWVVGGRWSGFLKPADSSVAHEKGRPGVFGCEVDTSGADVIRKRDVDFDSMRDKAATKAAADWDKVRGIIGDSIDSFVKWDTIRDERGISAGRDVYHNQHAVARIREASKTDRDLVFVNVEDFLVTRDEYVSRKRNDSTCPFAFVRNGEWVERGNMGWFACVSNEVDRDEWSSRFNAMLDELPDDSWLTVVDCHI